MLGRVLVILTSSKSITLKNGNLLETGYDQFSFVEVVDTLLSEGFGVDIATIGGHTPNQDPHCLNHLPHKDKDYYKSYMEANPQMLLPKNITNMSEEALQHYVALFIPGGYSALEEFCSSPDILKVMKHFHHYAKTIGVIGSASAALIHSELPWLFTDYRIACLNNEIENAYESHLLPGELPFHVNYILEQLGGKVSYSHPLETHIIEHKELLSAQNKYSAYDFAKQLTLKIKYALKIPE
jgi:putative intracellular protease/amidase